MKLLEKGVYKVFAGLVLVSMIGALVAEPVVVGDIGWYLGGTLGTGVGYDVGKKLTGNDYIAHATGYIAGKYGRRYGWEVGMEVGAEIGALAGPEGIVIGGIAGAL